MSRVFVGFRAVCIVGRFNDKKQFFVFRGGFVCGARARGDGELR
jgi:hypothetical protein